MPKYIVTVAFVAFFVALATGVAIDTRITDSHNIDQCDATKAAENLLSTNIYEPAKFLGFAKRTINYPEAGINAKPITCIKVINMDSSDHGGYPEIISGGVAATDVQIRLTSRLGLPLNFRVEIWA